MKIVVGIVLVCLVVLAIAVLTWAFIAEHDLPCSAFENVTLKNLPARCVVYFNGR